MRTWGLALCLVGLALLAVGLFGDISIPSRDGSRTINLGLMAMQGAQVTAGGAFLVAGAVLFAAAEIIRAAEAHARQTQRLLSDAMSDVIRRREPAPPQGSAPAPVVQQDVWVDRFSGRPR
jgi:hypothetical protein